MMKKTRNIKRKIIQRYVLVIFILLMIAVCTFQYIRQGNIKVDATEEEKFEQQTIITSIEANDDVLLNPGKGFTLDGDMQSSYEDMIAVGYARYNWSEIEESEGIYNWNLIDECIEEYAAMGKKFAFGVMCANSYYDGQYVTPKWVFDAGAEGITQEVTFWYNNKTQLQTIPIWTDEVFLEKLNNFIVALGKRYDNNSQIAYIDIRSYGNWGEQHNEEIGGKDITAEQLKKLYIQPYIDNFKNTLLVNPWGKEIYNSTYKWAIENGVTIRRDGIFMYSDGSECLMAYEKLPTIYEYTEKYEWLKENNLWSQSTLEEYIEIGKPSYIQFDADMYEENEEFCRRIANKIGYYFRLKQVQYVNTVAKNENTNIKLTFSNEGVAPLYEDCYVYIGLLDENDNLIKKYKTNIDANSWQPGKEVIESINMEFTDIENGKYSLAVGLYLNEDDENPTYLLGNEGKTNEKWYKFGNITICNSTQIINENTQSNENIQSNGSTQTNEGTQETYSENNENKTSNIDDILIDINTREDDGSTDEEIKIDKDKAEQISYKLMDNIKKTNQDNKGNKKGLIKIIIFMLNQIYYVA